MIDRAKALLADLDAWSMRHHLPRVVRRAVTAFLAHDALQFAGGMAYFAVLSIFQLLVLAVVIGSLFLGEGAARDFVITRVADATPLDPELVGDVIDGIIEGRGGMTIISVAFLAWSALGLFSALSNGIARVFDNTPRRPFIKDKLIGLLLMSLTGVLASASVAIGLITGIIQNVAQELDSEVLGGETAVWLIGLLAPIALIFLAFWFIYRVVPNRPVGWQEVLPGAIVATALWTVLRFGFTWYATNVANYESVFGPIATGITFLVFLYFASITVLLGAEFARASALDDELGRIDAADPRFLPVPVAAAPSSAPAPSRGLPTWAIAAAAALAGLLVGRLTKRSDDGEDL